MNGFAEAAIGLAFATQLLALDAVLTLHFLEDGKPKPARAEARYVATQKKMHNPWEHAPVAADEGYRAK